ncbi:MAG: tetratricopeptide repeat protein [Acetobacteraceae bacterium]
MADIFDEIEEDLRKERARRLWDRYAWIVLTAAGALLLAIAGWQGWRWYERTERTRAADRFAAAATTAARGDTAAAIDAFAALARDAPAGYRLLARFQEAAGRGAAGDPDAAVGLYESIAADGGVPALYRDLAVLLSVMHQADRADPAALAQRLSPLAAEGAPWRHSARELQAVLAARRGDRAEAATLLRALAADPAAPDGARRRAGELLGALGG